MIWPVLIIIGNYRDIRFTLIPEIYLIWVYQVIFRCYLRETLHRRIKLVNKLIPQWELFPLHLSRKHIKHFQSGRWRASWQWKIVCSLVTYIARFCWLFEFFNPFQPGVALILLVSICNATLGWNSLMWR